MDGLDKLGIKYNFQSGYKAYKSGVLVKQIELILLNADRIGKKIEELTGQTKYLESLPYFPQCHNCGRLNVARPVQVDPEEMRVYYRCTGDEIGKKWIEGCGDEGSVDIRKGEGKLSWKVEFAARWSAFDIRYEAHGKELIDSVRINDWISDDCTFLPASIPCRLRTFPRQVWKEDIEISWKSRFAPKVANLRKPPVTHACLLQTNSGSKKHFGGRRAAIHG